MEAFLQLARLMPQAPTTEPSFPLESSSTGSLQQQVILAQQAAGLAGLTSFGQDEFMLRLQLLIGQLLTASAVEAEVNRLRTTAFPQADTKSEGIPNLVSPKTSVGDDAKGNSSDDLSADARLKLLSALATSRLGQSVPAQASDILALASQANQSQNASTSTDRIKLTTTTHDDSESSKVSAEQATMTKKSGLKTHMNASIGSGFKRKTKREQFPERLYRILEELEQEGQDDIVSFVNQGSAFEIHQPEAFEEQVLPRYFRQGGIASFKKQLHLYNFRRVKTDSRGFAASLIFAHANFQRGKPELCLLMDRVNKNISQKNKAKAAKLLHGP